MIREIFSLCVCVCVHFFCSYQTCCKEVHRWLWHTVGTKIWYSDFARLFISKLLFFARRIRAPWVCTPSKTISIFRFFSSTFRIEYAASKSRNTAKIIASTLCLSVYLYVHLSKKWKSPNLVCPPRRNISCTFCHFTHLRYLVFAQTVEAKSFKNIPRRLFGK